MNDSPKRYWKLLIVLGLLVLIGSVSFFLIKGRQKFISPIPVQPSFKVTYFTPTPGPVAPSSTPSATPKLKKSPTNSPVPTVENSPTPTSNISASATPKP